MVKSAKTSTFSHGISLLSSLLSSINSKAVPKRALFSNLPFEIGPAFRISVKGYIIFKRQEPKPTAWVWLNGSKAVLAKVVTSKRADDEGREVAKAEVRKAYKFGGQQISFSLDEIAAIRNFGEPIIRIIGFKPLSPETLPIWANINRSTLIYPSEEEFVGSSRVFSALQQKLLKDRKMAVAWFIARKNAAPQISAVVPGGEELDDEGEQKTPPGLWVIPMPSADDIRINPETTTVPAPDSLVDKMRTVVQQLQLPKAQYFPDKYPNPALQWHYRILQALALNEDLPQQAEDKTVPRYRQIHKRAGGYVVDWGTDLEKTHRDWMDQNRHIAILPKRSAPSLQKDSEGGSRKKPKKAADVEVIRDNEMQAHFKKNSIAKVI